MSQSLIVLIFVVSTLLGCFLVTNKLMLHIKVFPCLMLQARARIELREVATDQDARDVIEIMKYRYFKLYHLKL